MTRAGFARAALAAAVVTAGLTSGPASALDVFFGNTHFQQGIFKSCNATSACVTTGVVFSQTRFTTLRFISCRINVNSTSVQVHAIEIRRQLTSGRNQMLIPVRASFQTGTNSRTFIADADIGYHLKPNESLIITVLRSAGATATVSCVVSGNLI
jgi:hypothetical protein